MSNVSERLAALRESNNRSLSSTASSSFPIGALMQLAIKGAPYGTPIFIVGLLYSWLKPIDRPAFTVDKNKRKSLYIMPQHTLDVANMLSIPEQQLLEILRKEVYPSLAKQGINYDF